MGFVLSKSYNNDQYYPRSIPYSNKFQRTHRHEHYVKDNFNVYWRSKKVSGTTVMNFEDLGYGYGKDSFNVFYKGKKIDANAMNFYVQDNGYAKDTFNIYYKGNIISKF